MGDKIPYTPFHKRDSKYYSDLAKRRKNPHLTFKDKVLASKAGKKSKRKALNDHK